SAFQFTVNLPSAIYRPLSLLPFLRHPSHSLFLIKNPFGLNEFEFVLKLLSSLLLLFSHFNHFLYERLFLLNLFLNLQFHSLLFLSVDFSRTEIPQIVVNLPRCNTSSQFCALPFSIIYSEFLPRSLSTLL
ncbi:hypothetical protein PFISCL1PPCAC_9221, partial [Pristionchus fissidentatus]